MRRKLFILISVLLLFELPSFEQCPSRDAFYQKIMAAGSGSIPNDRLPDTLLEMRRRLTTCRYGGDSAETSLLRQMGWVYFDRKDYLTAVSYFKQSVNIINKNINSRAVRPKDLISSYYFLSLFSDSLSNGPDKRKYIDSCITIAFRLNLQQDLSFLRALFSRLQYFYDIGEYRLCIADAVLCEKYAGEYLKTVSAKDERKAGVYIQQSSFGWNLNALLNLTAFTEAEKILTEKINEYRKAGLHDYLAFTYSKLAYVKEKKGDYKKALSFYMLAFELYRRGRDNFNCKQTLGIIGDKIYFRHYRDYDNAMNCFRHALTFKNTDSKLMQVDPMEELNIYGKIANIYVERKQYDSAFLNFDLAFGRIMKGLNEKNILQHKDLNEFSRLHKIDYLFGLLIDKGDAFKRRFETTGKVLFLQEGVEAYTIADKLLERIIKAQFEPDSRLYWRRDSRRLYENAIRAAHLANDAEKVFYFFERSRAVLLAMQLNEQDRLGKDDISGMAVLKKKLMYFEGLRRGVAVHSAAYKNYSDSILMKSQALYYLQEMIKQKNRLYYQNNDTSITTLRSVRENLLKDHAGLFEIFSGESIIYSLLITKDSVYTASIDKTAYKQISGKYVSYIANRNLQNADFAGFRTVSHKLYKLIFDDMPVPAGRIIISPEGDYFPFESLVTDNNVTNPVYFLADHAVSYTYSARYLFSNAVSPPAAPSGIFFGIAPIQYASNAALNELAGSDLSLKNIGEYMRDPVFMTRQNASRNNFLLQFPKYTIIQLYTHASDSSSRKEPVIYFNDSALYLSELVPGAKPVTQLVVLSACQTGNGVHYQGEGVFSFNRAFAALGVPSSVTNLWSVDNISTYQLTELFYKYLSRGLPLDIALQKTKLEYINSGDGENRLPYYWAAPILVGKTRPIAMNKPFAWKYIFAGIGLAGLAFISWNKLRKKKLIIPTPGTTRIAP